jgi:hypothetical protein
MQSTNLFVAELAVCLGGSAWYGAGNGFATSTVAVRT